MLAGRGGFPAVDHFASSASINPSCASRPPDGEVEKDLKSMVAVDNAAIGTVSSEMRG